jgi:hypothetical protein
VTSPICAVADCGRPTESSLCALHWGCLERALRDVPWVVEELTTTLARQDKVGGGSIGFVTGGGDEQPMPINLGASDAGIRLRQRLGLWVRDLWETHGVPDPDGNLPALQVANTAASLSRWLLRHPTWMRAHPAAQEMYEEILEDVGQAKRTIDRALGRIYVGVCSAPIEEGQCPEDLYGVEAKAYVTCRSCGTEHVMSSRRDVLRGALEDQYASIRDLVGLVNGSGHRLTTSMVRNLKSRQRLNTYVADPDTPPDKWGSRVRLKIDGDVGPDLYRLGDVLDAITTKWARKPA